MKITVQKIEEISNRIKIFQNKKLNDAITNRIIVFIEEISVKVGQEDAGHLSVTGFMVHSDFDGGTNNNVSAGS